MRALGLLLLPCLGCTTPEGRWEGRADVVVYGRTTPFDFELDVHRDTRVKRVGELVVEGIVEGEGQVHEVEGVGPWQPRRVETKLEPLSDDSGISAAIAFTLQLKLRGDTLNGEVEVLKKIDRFDDVLELVRVE